MKLSKKLQKRLQYSNDDYESYLMSLFCDGRLEEGLNTMAKNVEVNGDADEIRAWLSKFFFIVDTTANASFVGFSHCGEAAFTIKNKSWAVKITFVGEESVIETIAKQTREKFSTNPCYVRWVYDPQYLDDITVPLNTTHMPMQEMYPFLDTEIKQYYNNFVNSSANILLLIGKPGTGKTTFVRGLLSHTGKSATLTYHEKILEQDAFFVNWLENEDMFMIIEDADTLLLPRTEGNNLMAKFLNMGDGLMGFKNKKLIFSTNLPNINDIDTALTRPGRCFDILEFRNLNRKEAKVLADKINTPLMDGDQFTVSEIFAAMRREQNVKEKKSSFGFI